MINKTHLFEGLRQLASKKLQHELWMDGKDNQMSSFTEAICYVFDDSGVARALESGCLQSDVSTVLCSKLEELRRLIHQVPENVNPNEIIEHPKMEKIRPLAAELLDLFSAEFHNRG